MAEMEREEALDPILADLIAAEKDRPDPDPEAGARVLGRLALALPLNGPAVGGDAPTAAAAPAAAVRASRGTVRAAMVFLAGVGVGAGGHALLRPVVERTPPAVTAGPTVRPVPPAPSRSPAPDVVVAPPPSMEPTGGDRPGPRELSGPRAPHPVPERLGVSHASETPDSVLRAERKIIEIARTALGRGQPAAALEHLRKHARLFPQGQLVEEREGLMVQALVSVGNFAEARARAEPFHARYPRSLFGPAVEASIRSIP